MTRGVSETRITMASNYNLKKATLLGRGALGEVYALNEQTVVKKISIKDKSKKKTALQDLQLVLDCGRSVQLFCYQSLVCSFIY